jgi:fatty-acyl-CoA synthase
MRGLMMDYPLTIDRILEHANRIYPHKQIITRAPDGTLHRYAYTDVYRRVKRLANALKRLGVQSGDRVGTFAWNNYQHLELYYAVPCSSAVIHTLNIRLAPKQLAHIISRAEDKIIFIDATLLPRFEPVARRLDDGTRYVLFNHEESAETSLARISGYEGLMAQAEADDEWNVIDERTAMGLCYTSGATGEPKGVLYSHRAVYLHALGVNQANVFGLTEADRMLLATPMFHAMGWGLPYACAFAGADLVLPGADVRPAAIVELIANEHVTIAAGVPTIWTTIYHELQANPRDISSLRAILVGGSAMPGALIEAYEKELGVEVIHAWGMTELSPTGTVSRLQSHHRRMPRQAQWEVKAKQGVPVPGIELRIVDESGRELPWDNVTMGEVQVRGAWAAGGYYRDENNAAYFTADGWFRTGDVATISPDGYMQITDRTKDLIRSGGEWISSVALENALLSCAGVLEAAVIAVPDEKWGERPLAVVAPVPGNKSLTAEALIACIAPRFPKFWLPDRIVFVNEIPKTGVGKLDKQALRRRYR